MSIFNDYRRYGSDEERSEWEKEVKYEFRREDSCNDCYYDDDESEDDEKA